MNKITFILILVICSFSVFSQQKTVEQTIADTTCTCLQNLGAKLVNTKLMTQTDSCILKAIKINSDLIEKSFSSDKEKEIEEGTQKEITQKVLPILLENCKAFSKTFNTIKNP